MILPCFVEQFQVGARISRLGTSLHGGNFRWIGLTAIRQALVAATERGQSSL